MATKKAAVSWRNGCMPKRLLCLDDAESQRTSSSHFDKSRREAGRTKLQGLAKVNPYRFCYIRATIYNIK